MKPTLIITGGSSGIGKATADLFANKGWRVYELSRNGKSNTGIIHIDCDVTIEEQVTKAVKTIAATESKIDLLISNAGFGISGAIEFTDAADARRQLDVNVLGSFNIAKATLPYMRRQRSGMIIFTSSIAAVLSIPYQAFYSASKSAINALALALRNEVSSFGIKVCAMMPGDVKTGFTDARNKSNAGIEVYKSLGKSVAIMENDERNGMSADRIAHKLWKIAHKKNPKPLYTTGAQYQLFVVLEKLLPKRFSNWVVGKLYC